MFRALLELIVTILVAFAARAILSSLMKGFASSAGAAFQGQTGPQPNPGQQPRPAEPRASGELHKDPVCGTYVAESTSFRRQSSGQTYYYCSATCRDRHSLKAS